MTLAKIISLLSVALLIGSSDAANKRIFGGESVQIKDYPYQASLRLLNKHFCGGSIIGERHILTAAHCINKYMKRPFTFVSVVTGTSFSTKGGQSHRIAKVDVHPGWTMSEEDSFQNDVAVITLRDKIEFDEYQQKVNLPTQNVENGEKANFTGWGLVRQSPDTLPKQLQMIKTTLITSEKCEQKMLQPEVQIYKTQVCALRAPRIGACSGDSGGPLVVKGEVVGIASWVETESCAIGSPDVYTNVYKFKDFIESVVNKN